MKKIIKLITIASALLNLSSSGFSLELQSVEFSGDGCDSSNTDARYDEYHKVLRLSFWDMDVDSQYANETERKTCLVHSRLTPTPGYRVQLNTLSVAGEREVLARNGSVKATVANEFSNQTLEPFTEAIYGLLDYEGWTASSPSYQSQGACDQPVLLASSLRIQATAGQMSISRGGLNFSFGEVRCECHDGSCDPQSPDFDELRGSLWDVVDDLNELSSDVGDYSSDSDIYWISDRTSNFRHLIEDRIISQADMSTVSGMCTSYRSQMIPLSKELDDLYVSSKVRNTSYANRWNQISHHFENLMAKICY